MTLQKPEPSAMAFILNEETLWTSRLKKLSPRLRELVSMHTYARPAGSQTEEDFIAEYIAPLKGAYHDSYGNWIVRVGRDPSPVCWTSHTDTVACYEGRQAICIDKDGLLALSIASDATCLGADCTVGVWLMRRMILAGKPGLYIFHRDEETGGEGSKWIVENTPELVEGIKFCISLDRRGYSSVITDQIYGTCASDEFAASIASQLGGSYKADTVGLFTDSAFYGEIVPECSNLSVGYHHAHSSAETLDFEFADNLLLKLLALDYSKLVCVRVPEPRPRYNFSRGYNYASTSTYAPDRHFYNEQWSDYLDGENDPTHDPYNPDLAEYVDKEILALVTRHPEAVTLLLQQWDLGIEEIYDVLKELKAYV